MEKHSRLTLIYAIIRRFLNDYKGSRYKADELTGELYVYVDDLIKSNPFIDNEEITKLALSKCAAIIKPLNKTLQLDEKRVAARVKAKFVESDDDKLLRLWCQTSYKRHGKKWLSRIIAYLHYVEKFSAEEIADIFGKSLPAIYASIYQVHAPRKKQFMLKPNDVVVLVMNNPFFNHMLAWVKEPTEWGAMVEVESHCYPHRKRWELRATHDEMVYVGSLANLPEVPKKESVDGSKQIVSNAQAMLRPEHVYTAEETARKILDIEPVGEFKPANGISDPQFTGDECTACGKMMMVRAGTCLTCLSCGTTTGC